MIRNVLESIGGIELYPVISLVLFTTFFAGMIVMVMRTRKSVVQHASRLPLEDEVTAPAPRSGDNHG